MFPWGNKRQNVVEKASQHVEECCQLFGLPQRQLSKSACDWLSRRSWKEESSEQILKRLMFTATLLAHDGEIRASHFPPIHNQDHEAYSKAHFDDLGLEEVVRYKISHFLRRLGRYEVTSVHKVVLEQVERPLIRLALQWAEGNQLKAARLLGMNRNTLRAKMKALGVERKGV